ncbi:MAG: response regulator transcription factor [Clostridia bacterium]|nr:response regulator transcription factor [Clostridia bacterium]
MKVLIVDDEKEIADLVALILEQEGYHTLTFYDSGEALSEITQNDGIELAVLDVMMPPPDGFALCKEIRKNHTYPIIMLTAKAEERDRVEGLSIGADDYVTKPFYPLELAARVKAQLRRYRGFASQRTERYEGHGLTVDRNMHTVFLFGEEVKLTPTEFDILWLLCQNEGKVVSSEEIFRQVWQEAYLDSNNNVMVHIRRLRDKLKEPPRKPRIIKTVWGVGYKIEG